MKRLTLLLTALVLTFSLQAQKSVKEKDVLGEWKLIIDINQDEIMEGVEEDEDIPFLGEWLAESVIGLVSNILDDLEIYFDFRKDGQVKIVAEIFGEREVEYSEWYINSRGELVIVDTDIFDNDNDVWVMENDRLVSYEKRRGRDPEADVYMIRID